MFNSAVTSTPSASSGLTALSAWILSCICLVKLALVFYVVILVNMKRLGKKTKPDTRPPVDRESSKKSFLNSIDLDPLFLVVHFVVVCLFFVTYFFIYLL